MKKVIQVCILALTACVAGCSKESDSVAGSTTPPSPVTVGQNRVDKAGMLALVNEVRAKGCNCGTTYMPPVGPLTWNDKLENAALAHTIDMFTHNFFEHTGSDGSTPSQRVTNAGYQWMATGENIAMGYTSEKDVMNGWLASEGHCLNIMRKEFKEMGAARVGNYWTQEFGTPR